MGKGNTNYGRTVGGTTSAPWEPQQPYIKQGFTDAQNQLNGPSTVAPFSPQTQQGLDTTMQTAQNAKIPQAAGDSLTKTLSGGYDSTAWMGQPGTTYQNAYIDQLAKGIGNKVVPDVMSQFGMAGRSGGSPLASEAVAEGISSSLAPYMFGSAENQMGRMFDSYQSERDRQMQALGMSPSIDQLQYSPANAMLGVGGAYDAQKQAQLNEPAQKLANYMNVVGSPYGSSNTTDITSPTSQDKPLGVGNVLTK